MSENDKIAGVYSKCPICNYKDFNFFLSGKELISEFVNKLRKYLDCETCTSTGKPITCKACCGLYPIIEEYEERLPDATGEG